MTEGGPAANRAHRALAARAAMAAMAAMATWTAMPALAQAPRALGAETAAGATAADRALLAASDLFAAAPAEFRAELELRKLGETEGTRLEIFHRGRDLELVRFLAPRERGKFLLFRDGKLYFLSPGSRRPVALAPGYRVQGAAIRELLGLDLARDYEISALREEAGIVTFELVAKVGDAAAPRLRWVVSRATGRPLRADLQSSAGKVLRVLEPKAWRDVASGVPELLVIKDVVSGGAPIEIRFLSFEPGPVDPVLFSLEDGAARSGLSSPASALRSPAP